MCINRMVLVIVLISCIAGCVKQPGNKLAVVENSIGKLIVLHDKDYSYQTGTNPFGSAKGYSEFIKLYNDKIKALSENHRVDYFWAAMWHLRLDGHSMEEFQKLIIADCGQSFISRLEYYIVTEQQLRRSKARLDLSKKVLAGLNLVRKRNLEQ